MKTTKKNAAATVNVLGVDVPVQVLEDCLLADMGFGATDVRKSDELDFREVGVWFARAAVSRAFAAGRAAAWKEISEIEQRAARKAARKAASENKGAAKEIRSWRDL